MVSKFNKYDVTSKYRGLKDDTKPVVNNGSYKFADCALNADGEGNSTKEEHDIIADMYRNAPNGCGVMETESGFDYERISNNVWSPDTYDGENTED